MQRASLSRGSLGQVHSVAQAATVATRKIKYTRVVRDCQQK